MRVRRSCTAALTAIVLTLGVSATAQADFLGHESSFDGSGSPGGAFVHPTSIGVNSAEGSVLVLDPGKASPVEQFDLAGNPKPFASKGGSNSLGPLALDETAEIAIDNSGTASEGNIYVASQTPGRVYGFDSAGNPLGGNWPLVDFGEIICGITVDSAGGVWPNSASTGTIEFTAAGVPTGRTSGHGGCHHRFNSEGFYYEGLTGEGFQGARMRKYLPPERYEDLTEAKTNAGFDIDLSTDDVYINNNKYVVVLNKTSATIERFGEKEEFGAEYPGLKNAQGLAVDPATGKVFVSDINTKPPRVEIFAPHAPLPPALSLGVVKQIRSSNAVIGATINPGGGATNYSVEYGLDDSYGSSGQPSPDKPIAGRSGQAVTINLEGLAPGTEYHYRVVAENSTTTTEGPDQTLVTYAPTPGNDECPNQLVRKQTGASGLADCRAYELASASQTGGYNVSSDLVAGQSPLPGFPAVTGPSKLLYTLASGSIPGSGDPTSFANDPYVATRGENGWTTEYVGIPANGTKSTSPFASEFTAADDQLKTFAFAGNDLCSPCFADGKTGIPVRRADGSIEQGMSGSNDPGPGAHADILVRKHLSADGSHLIFGSTEPFAAGAPPSGQPAIYSRDLETGTTALVSRTDENTNIPCLSACTTEGVAGLDVSADGSRVVVGQLVGHGPSGADLWHPYLNIDGASSSIDLAPGSTDGVLYYGMTDDGSKAFFSSDQQLTPEDEDNSVDLYRADVGSGGADLTLISQGSGNGNTDACDPVADADHEHWNSLGPAANCDVVPVAGGAGLGRADGSFYFLSPEQLVDDSGAVIDAPNLYLAKPSGELVFVATLESDLNLAEELTYQRLQSDEIGGFTEPGQLTVDKKGGYLFVVDAGTNTVSRFDEQGNPAPFSFAAPYVSGNKLTGITGTSFGLTLVSQVAVDESGGPGDGYVYVGDTEGSGAIDVFKSSGEYIGQLPTSGRGSGVAVSPNGVIYAVGELIYRYKATTADPATFDHVGPSFSLGGACLLASDSLDDLLYQCGEGSPVIKRNGETWEEGNTQFAPSANSFALESGGDDYLIGHGNSIDEFNADGTIAVADIGQGVLTGSPGVAALSGGSVYATDAGDHTVKIFGPPQIKFFPEPSTSPIVLQGVEHPDVADPADIQVEPTGGSAAFVSAMPLTGDVVGQKRQVFRYDAAADSVDCASCNLTRVAPVDGGRLSAYGSSLASEGRVFFNTAEPLVLRDANGRVDVYQWSKAKGVQLVSPGNSQFDNTLLSVSRDGTDAYFFTRNTLVPQDENGELMKIYDARAGGGFLVSTRSVPCAASDECHGAGTEPPPPLVINTVGNKTGKNANFNGKKKCGKGKVRKHGKCVKKKSHKKKSHKKGRAAR